MSDKPREWWIKWVERGDGPVRDIFDGPVSGQHWHVIEKSAYDKLEKQLAEARAEIERLKQNAIFAKALDEF